MLDRTINLKQVPMDSAKAMFAPSLLKGRSLRTYIQQAPNTIPRVNVCIADLNEEKGKKLEAELKG